MRIDIKTFRKKPRWACGSILSEDLKVVAEWYAFDINGKMNPRLDRSFYAIGKDFIRLLTFDQEKFLCEKITEELILHYSGLEKVEKALKEAASKSKKPEAT